MTKPSWVRRETMLALHEQSLAQFGGRAGIRDEGLLDSALGRPENSFAYGKPTIYRIGGELCFRTRTQPSISRWQ